MKALTRLPPGFGRSTLPHIQTVWSGGLMKMSWDGKKWDKRALSFFENPHLNAFCQIGRGMAGLRPYQ